LGHLKKVGKNNHNIFRVKCPCSVGTFEKQKLRNKIKKKIRNFSNSVPIKDWPRQQKNKRKKKTIKIKETRKLEQQKNLQKCSKSHFFSFKKNSKSHFSFEENFLSLTFATLPSYFLDILLDIFS
jgi:tRNA(Ile)-lysidine synthase TilS/MesJ